MNKTFFFRYIIPGLFCLFSIALIAGILLCSSVLQNQKEIASHVLRLHIIANSDQAQDQRIKLQVRDRILSDCGFLFQNCTNAQEAAKRAKTYAPLLQRTAQAELKKQGFLGRASVTIEPCRFPTRDYGGVRLPAGTYTAVNIRIGAAAGHNWWCVMYPPLCLTGDAVKADDETLQDLRQELSAEEYAMVTQTGEIRIQMKLKIAEILSQYFPIFK
ncbi:stage II sporulation protein R [Ructibacterium gallinarum]|uniref:Stage II sporulation protein R n=1 Tax=Ructibacterium gallinarum TaxID=2779355 RepID=A0A9D5R8G6_9FIRM|nr:stage II sporulation protein R [Ructibacterium gallinarum]MBE5039942.1 stage II sporulation protein R [Ructibacterium gallinarum]